MVNVFSNAPRALNQLMVDVNLAKSIVTLVYQVCSLLRIPRNVIGNVLLVILLMMVIKRLIIKDLVIIIRNMNNNEIHLRIHQLLVSTIDNCRINMIIELQI